MRDQKETVRPPSAEVYRARVDLRVCEHAKEKLTARLAKLRALGATLSRLPFDEAAHLRNVFRRSRGQKSTITGLRRAVKAAKARLARLRTPSTARKKRDLYTKVTASPVNRQPS